MRLHHAVAALPLLLHPRPPQPRAAAPTALISDGAIVFAAACLAAAAGYLQYSVSAGDKGINAFLMKEKSENPFYQKDFVPQDLPKPPKWLQNVRLPQLDFVEVYGQEKTASKGPLSFGSSPQQDGLDALYAALDAAVEREDYAAAQAYKEQIDRKLEEESKS